MVAGGCSPCSVITNPVKRGLLPASFLPSSPLSFSLPIPRLRTHRLSPYFVFPLSYHAVPFKHTATLLLLLLLLLLDKKEKAHTHKRKGNRGANAGEREG